MKKLAAAVLVLVVLGVGASRVYDWWNYNLTTPVATSSQPVAFRVAQGEIASAVADDLYSKGLIRNRDIFEWYLRLTGVGSKFQAGSFLLNRNMSILQIIDALQRSNPDQKVITIPEGFPLKFQADFVEKAWPGMGKAYLQAATDPSWKTQYDFLKSRPPGANPPLEGYLFPDTYVVDPNGGVNGLIQQQLDQFGKGRPTDLVAARGVGGGDRHPCIDGGARGEPRSRPRQRLQRVLQPPRERHDARRGRDPAVRPRTADP